VAPWLWLDRVSIYRLRLAFRVLLGNRSAGQPHLGGQLLISQITGHLPV
jgi:hypothetical protein